MWIWSSNSCVQPTMKTQNFKEEGSKGNLGNLVAKSCLLLLFGQRKNTLWVNKERVDKIKNSLQDMRIIINETLIIFYLNLRALVIWMNQSEERLKNDSLHRL